MVVWKLYYSSESSKKEFRPKGENSDDTYEVVNNKITGNLIKAAFACGKLEKVKDWCDTNNYNLDESFFYTDSINDLPLIKACPNSIIISPDKKLEKYAKENNLSILERKIHE